MSPGATVSHWLSLLKAGDRSAAQPLWDRYYQQLVVLARGRLQGLRRVADEEDVALSAFASFCKGAEAGRFPQLEGRDDLWKLLVVLTARKAADQLNRERRRKRGGGAVRGDSAFGPRGEEGPGGLEEVIGQEPTPAFAAQVAEECGRLLDRLDDVHRAVVVWKMEGYSSEEIAGKLGCALSTVERRLRLIRQAWREG
jgi:DNA-directed RNA polymerase specialized sigma24 family protein